MNYEIKSINPGSVFFNAVRVFIIVGFVVAVISLFIMPSPNIRITAIWQKFAATLLFTVVYGIVVSVVLTFVAWLYNFWTSRFKGVSIHLEQQ